MPHSDCPACCRRHPAHPPQQWRRNATNHQSRYPASRKPEPRQRTASTRPQKQQWKSSTIFSAISSSASLMSPCHMLWRTLARNRTHRREYTRKPHHPRKCRAPARTRIPHRSDSDTSQHETQGIGGRDEYHMPCIVIGRQMIRKTYDCPSTRRQ